MAVEGSIMAKPRAIVFDVGRVMFQWQLRALFEKLISDPAELDWFLTNVVSEEWHFQHDRGVPLSDMVPARMAQFPEQTLRIAAYAARFNETIPGPVPGTLGLVEELYEAGVPLFCLTNFGDELFAEFRKTQPIFDRFADIIVSGEEGVAKPGRKIYDIVEERSGYRGDALFFTDDNPDNIAAAIDCGWHGHLFEGAAELRTELVQHGFLE
jgi:2-haloacid dehalogenase